MTVAPGIYSSTSVRAGSAGAGDVEASTFYVAGLTERGSTVEPILIRSMAEYGEQFGDRVAYGSLYDACQLHFQEGGARIAVRRVVGPAATVGSLTLQDKAGTPLNTIRIDATSAGPWSARVSIQVEQGSQATQATISVFYDGLLAERYADLSTPAAIVSALSASRYVRAVDLASATATPNNIPKILAATVLSTGGDDRASVTGANLVAALPTGDTVRTAGGTLVPAGGGCCAIPGQTADVIGAALIAYASANSRIAYVTMAPGSSDTTITAAARTLGATVSSAGTAPRGRFLAGAVVAPVEGGGTRLLPAEAYQAAARARAIASAGGPWQEGAGALSGARWVLGVDQAWTPAQLAAFELARVVPLKTVLGQVRVYGNRSLSADEANWKSTKDADVLNYVDVAVRRALEEVNFTTSDGSKGRALGLVKAAVVDVVEPMARLGAFYPSVDGRDEGWTVDVSASVNTAASLAAGELRVAVGVRPAPTANKIFAQYIKAAPSASL